MKIFLIVLGVIGVVFALMFLACAHVGAASDDRFPNP